MDYSEKSKQQGISVLRCHSPWRRTVHIICRNGMKGPLGDHANSPGWAHWAAPGEGGQTSQFFGASALGAKIHLAQKLKHIHGLCSQPAWDTSACAWMWLCFESGFFQAAGSMWEGSNSSSELCDVKADQMYQLDSWAAAFQMQLSSWTSKLAPKNYNKFQLPITGKWLPTITS